MRANLRVSSLIPAGLVVETVIEDGDMIVVTARAAAWTATCPLCGLPSRLVHSLYVRRVSDLPCSGRAVCLRVVARRFLCKGQHCRRRIFAERFDRAVLAERSRRTSRLTGAERLQYEGYLRREETNAAILALHKAGVPIKQIVRQTGHSRQLVRHVLRGVQGDVFRTWQSSLDAYLARLDA